MDYEYTTNPPTEPGWYWQCYVASNGEVQDETIIRVVVAERDAPTFGFKRGDLVRRFGTSLYAIPERLNLRWCGPLPHPTNSKGAQP